MHRMQYIEQWRLRYGVVPLHIPSIAVDHTPPLSTPSCNITLWPTLRTFVLLSASLSHNLSLACSLNPTPLPFYLPYISVFLSHSFCPTPLSLTLSLSLSLLHHLNPWCCFQFVIFTSFFLPIIHLQLILFITREHNSFNCVVIMFSVSFNYTLHLSGTSNQ